MNNEQKNIKRKFDTKTEKNWSLHIKDIFVLLIHLLLILRDLID